MKFNRSLTLTTTKSVPTPQNNNNLYSYVLLYKFISMEMEKNCTKYGIANKKSPAGTHLRPIKFQYTQPNE